MLVQSKQPFATPGNPVNAPAFSKKMKALGLRRGAEKDAGTSGGEG